jgi:lipase chaperone LimK
MRTGSRTPDSEAAARRSPRIAAAAVVVAAIALSAALWTRPGTAPQPVAPIASERAAIAAQRGATPAARAVVAASGVDAETAELLALRARLQRSSLRGATPDGQLVVDAEGRLQGGAELRRRFDWYLSLDGEFTLEAIRTLLLADVRDAHGAELAAQVAEWFERYLGLRAELADLALSGDPRQRLRQLSDAQRRWFGAEAEAWFGEELAQLQLSVEQQAIARDAALDAAQREALLAAVDAARPESQRTVEREATAALLLAEQDAQFESLGLDAAARHAERSALWGEVAATRLAALDQAQAAWEARLRGYARERERLLGATTFEAAQRERALRALRERHFGEAERARVEALEAIGQLPPRG